MKYIKEGTKVEQTLYVVNTPKNKVFGRSLLLFGETVVTHLYLPGVTGGSGVNTPHKGIKLLETPRVLEEEQQHFTQRGGGGYGEDNGR